MFIMKHTKQKSKNNSNFIMRIYVAQYLCHSIIASTQTKYLKLKHLNFIFLCFEEILVVIILYFSFKPKKSKTCEFIFINIIIIYTNHYNGNFKTNFIELFE